MTKNYTDVGTLLIRNSDIKDNHFEFDSNPIHLDEGFAKSNDSRRMHIGDVVTVHTGDVGTSAVITEKEDGSIGFATIVTRPNKEIIDSNYLSTYLNTEQHKNWAINQSTGDGRTNYNLKEFTQLIVPLPSLKEQQCISKYIKQIDNLITLHQSKYDKLVNVKKALLEKMFPKDGKNVPEIRFKGFTDTWEQRKLGEIATFKQGIQVDLNKQTTEINKNSIRFIRIVDYTQNTDDLRYIDKSLAKEYINKEDVVVVRYGATAGFVGHGISGVLANNMFTINPEKIMTKEYLYTYLKQEKIYKLLNESNGSSAMPALNFTTVKDVNIEYPLPSEQIKISDMFKQIDNLITLHQHKCFLKFDNNINIELLGNSVNLMMYILSRKECRLK